MKKQTRKYFLIFDKTNCRSLAVVEAPTRGDAVGRAQLVAHLMPRPPEHEERLDATRIKHSGAPIGLPTFLEGFFLALLDAVAAA